MNSGYSSPYSVKPDSTPIQQSLNTDDQKAKYKEEEKTQKAPPELPFELDRITEVLGDTFVSLAQLRQMLKNASASDSIDQLGVNKIVEKIDIVNEIILAIPEDLDILKI